MTLIDSETMLTQMMTIEGDECRSPFLLLYPDNLDAFPLVIQLNL